jgi:hypothetical protein
MLNATIAPAHFEGYQPPRRLARVADAVVGRIERRAPARIEEATPACLLASYLDGWAEADPAKIAAATAPGYRFDDPLVGTYSQGSLPRYFKCLEARFAVVATCRTLDTVFRLRGPMDTRSLHDELQFWRETPRLGLSGTAHIILGAHGVISERVAYDLNMASEQLRLREAVLPASPICSAHARSAS